jgi:hypothetical protein
LRRDPRVSFLVEDGQTWTELRAALLLEFIRIESDPDQITAATALLRKKYRGDLPSDTRASAVARHNDVSFVILIISAVHPLVAWDHRKINP